MLKGWLILAGRPAAQLEAVFALLALSATAGEAGAQVQDGTDASPIDMIVTARRREEALLQVPLAVSVFDRAALERDRIDSVADLVQRVPSATFSVTGPAFTNEIMIRGVGNGRGINAETAVGLYRNGFYSVGGNLGGRSLGRMDFFDVQRVEVLRGPQGGLFGRNAVGGAINIITVQPQDRTEGAALLSLASDARVEGEAILNLAPSEDVTARVGLLGMRQREGDVRNADGAVLDRESFAGGRATVTVKPASRLTMTASLEHFSEHGPGFAVFAYNQLGLPGERFRRRMNAPSRFRRIETFGTLRIAADLSFATLTSGTMAKSRRASTDDDMDSWNAAASPLLVNWRRQSFDRFDRFGQELRLASSADRRLRWMIGGELLTLDGSFEVPITGATGTAQAQNSRNLTRSDDRSLALFGTVEVQPLPGFTLAGEIRTTWDRKKIGIEATTFSIGGVRTDRSFRFDRTFANVSPVATLTWRPSADTSVYVRYATGFRAGGFNNEPDPLAPERFSIAYRPETTNSVELGGRMQAWNRRIGVAATLYRMETDDLIVPITHPVVLGGVSRIISALGNVGRSRQSGVEAELDAALIRSERGGRFDVRLALAHGWGSIREGQFASLPVPRLRAWTVAASSIWRQPLTKALALTLGTSFRGEYGGVQGTVPVPLDDIAFTDIQVGLEGACWRVVGTVENVADRLFDGDRNGLDPVTGLFRQVYTTRPRRFSLRASIRL